MAGHPWVIPWSRWEVKLPVHPGNTYEYYFMYKEPKGFLIQLRNLRRNVPHVADHFALWFWLEEDCDYDEETVQG